MPCYALLGIEFCIPSVDDIVNAVMSPITSVIFNGLNNLANFLGPKFDAVVNTISPLFQGVIDAITGFFSDPIGAIYRVLGDIWGGLSGLGAEISAGLGGLWDSIGAGLSDIRAQFGAGLNGLWGSITAGLSSLGGHIEGFIGASSEALNNAINAAGSTLSGALEGAQGAILGAFNALGDGIGGMMGGLFSGFGSVDTNAILGAHQNVLGLLENAVAQLGLSHSPVTPREAEGWVPGFIAQVTAAATALHVSNTVAEGASLGQFDVTLGEAWKYPNTAGALEVATEFVGMPLREGLGPAYKRWILKTYQPNIPPYMDLISIYVKEGYLADHWVELPEEMVDNFKELGFSEYWTQRLWGKHWVYPSATQLFEMLHRTAGTRPEIGVTVDVLRGMLKLHDYEPKWRGPLEQISWGTWRIYDTRTAWEMGIDSDETLFKRLVDQGYEPKDAQLLADVQKMFVLRSEIDGLTREADQDFIEGFIDESQLKADYEATPYNPFVIELRIAKAKLRRDRELKRDMKSALVNRYKKGDLSAEELKLALSHLGVVETWIATEIEKADAIMLRKVYEDTTVAVKGLTEAKYSRAFRVGLITEETYRTHLAALKYGPGDQELLVELNTPEKPSPEEVKQLTAAELKAAFRVGVLSESELETELTERRYSPEDISTIIKTEKTKIKPGVAG